MKVRVPHEDVAIDRRVAELPRLVPRDEHHAPGGERRRPGSGYRGVEHRRRVHLDRDVCDGGLAARLHAVVEGVDVRRLLPLLLRDLHLLEKLADLLVGGDDFERNRLRRRRRPVERLRPHREPLAKLPVVGPLEQPRRVLDALLREDLRARDAALRHHVAEPDHRIRGLPGETAERVRHERGADAGDAGGHVARLVLVVRTHLLAAANRRQPRDGAVHRGVGRGARGIGRLVAAEAVGLLDAAEAEQREHERGPGEERGPERERPASAHAPPQR